MIRINNTQHPHFLEQADALRRSGTLCDAIISVKSHTFKAHRLVLACASRRLAQQLSKGDTDGPSRCTLEHFSPHTFQQILDFTYTQTLEVPEEDVYLLLRAAQLLDMQPLVDQCRKQLDALNRRDREDDRKEEIGSENEEEISHVQEEDPMKRELAHEDKIQGSFSPEEGVNKTTAAENLSNLVFAENHNGPPCPRQKGRLSPIPSTPDSRHISVITRPVTSCSSVLPACNFPSSKWTSVDTLRKIAENYSNLFPLPAINQSSVPYPFSLSTAHMFPLLSPHFQNPVHSSVIGYPGFYPYHSQNRFTSAAGMGSIIKQGLLRRKRAIHRDSSGDIQDGHSFHRVPKTSPDCIKDCRNCSSSLTADSTPRTTASTLSGKVCAGCRFCRKKYGLKREPQSKQHDQRGDKPYQCRHCPKKFSLKHQLDTHHRVHTGEKPFECRLCGQRSRDYSAMIKHLRTHGGATPYRCTVCLEFCSSLATMQKHIRNHAMQDFPPDWSINSTYLYISHI